jgi:acyl-CoA thioester hydrolase
MPAKLRCVDRLCRVIHTFKVQLRFSDIDSLGHVNNSRYLSYLEDARIELLANLAAAGATSLIAVILARVEIDYLKPVLLAREPLECDVWVTGIGSKSFGLGHEIRQAGHVAAKATAVMVAFDYDSQTTRVLADSERATLSDWLRD